MNREDLEKIQKLTNDYLSLCADVELGKINIETAKNLMSLIISLNAIISSIPNDKRKSNELYYPLVEMAYELYKIKDLNFS